jgi:hypothetical protein
VKRHAWLWFRPSEGTGYSGVVDRYGNTYLTRRMGATPRTVQVTYDEDEISSSGGGPLPCWAFGDCGEKLADLVPDYAEVDTPWNQPYVTIMGHGCPNCAEYAFEAPGAQVQGVLVANWNSATQKFDEFVGSKTFGETFDLKDASVATAVEADGRVSRFWTFGGRTAAGQLTAELWIGQRSMVIGSDGTSGSYFGLTSVPATGDGDWPAARVGAMLAVRPTSTFGPIIVEPPAVIGSGTTPSTFGAADGGGPPDGQERVGLLLVGGESVNGLLPDIWVYDREWRQSGWLPDVDGGLAEAGGVVTEEVVWLFGGRQAGGPSADLWKIDRAEGGAERIVPFVSPWPPARVSPAVRFDPASRGLVVFGGTDASGRGLTDLWSYDIEAGTWTELAPGCSGAACPQVTGAEKLAVSSEGVTVVADPYGPAGGVGSWTFEDGAWTTKFENMDFPLARDCDRDGATEAGWGARCGAGGDGFPAWGRTRIPAAEEGHRLFVNALAGTYVIDFASGPEPVLLRPIPTGTVHGMRVEDDFLYVDPVGCGGRLYTVTGPIWRAAGTHDVGDWVDGVVEAGRFSVLRRPGRLIVGTRQ